MITGAQMRAARALLGIDQKKLAEISGVSTPTIQRMEASDGNVRGFVDTLVKVVDALNAAGIELIGEQARSEGAGRGVRLRRQERPSPEHIANKTVQKPASEPEAAYARGFPK